MWGNNSAAKIVHRDLTHKNRLQHLAGCSVIRRRLERPGQVFQMCGKGAHVAERFQRLVEQRSSALLKMIALESIGDRPDFSSENPIGRTINQGPDALIVGVVGAIKHGDLSEPDKATVYYAYSQMAWHSGLYLALRTSQEPAAIVPQVRAVVAELDRNLPVYDVRLMQERVEDSLSARRLAMLVLTGFAVLALLLAVLGVYGVLSYSTRRRTHEVGIRLALGAVPNDVVRMVLRGGILLAASGLVAGLGGFLLLARLLSSMLYGVSPYDPVTIGIGIGLVAMSATVAAFLPARRAARVDPIEALREE